MKGNIENDNCNNLGVSEVKSKKLVVYDPNFKILKLTLKKTGSNKIVNVIFFREFNEVVIPKCQFYSLDLGAYFMQYSSDENKYYALPTMLDSQKKIKDEIIEKQILTTYYTTKGGNLGIRIWKLDSYFKVKADNDFIEKLKKNNIYLQQNDKYDSVFGNYQIHPSILIEQYTQLVNTGKVLFSIGTGSYVKNVDLPAETIVGRYSSIAPGVKAMRGSRHPMDRFTTSQISLSNPSEWGAIPTNVGLIKNNKLETAYYKERYEPIIIGNDVWIGQDVIIKRGVKIGDGAIVGQGAIVTKDIPPYAIVAGIPTSIIRYRFEKEQIKKLLTLKWWDYPYWEFDGIKAEDNIEDFIEKLSKLISENKIKKYIPKILTYNDFS